MASKTYAKKVENFALEPVGARPDGNKAIHDRVGASQADLQADSVATGDGNEVIIQLETGLVRETINASCIGEEIELKAGGVPTPLGDGAKDLAREDDTSFAPKFNDFLNGIGIPRSEVSGHDTSTLSSIFSHGIAALRSRLILMPVERAFFPQVKIADQEYGDVDHHFREAIQANTRRHFYQVTINVSPGI